MTAFAFLSLFQATAASHPTLPMHTAGIPGYSDLAHTRLGAEEPPATGADQEASSDGTPRIVLNPENGSPMSPGLSDAELMRLSLVPVPGFPSLYQRDLRHFGLAWAVVVPATAAFVGVAGLASFRRPQLIGLGLTGYYVSSVVASRALGIHSQRARLSVSTSAVTPGSVDGLAVSLQVPLP